MTLPHLEVLLASGLSVERTIGGIRGKTEAGHVSITESKDSVKIVVLEDPFKNSSPRVDKELVDFFIRLCAIEDVSRVSLVSLILKASFGDVRDLLEGANIRASTEVLDFCVDEAEQHAAAEDGEITGLNAAARGVFKQLSIGVPRLLSHATDHGPRIFTSAQQDLPSRFREIGLKAEIHVSLMFPEASWCSTHNFFRSTISFNNIFLTGSPRSIGQVISGKRGAIPCSLATNQLQQTSVTLIRRGRYSRPLESFANRGLRTRSLITSRSRERSVDSKNRSTSARTK